MFREQIERLLLQRPIPIEEIVALMAKASRLAEPADFELLVHIARLDDSNALLLIGQFTGMPWAPGAPQGPLNLQTIALP